MDRGTAREFAVLLDKYRVVMKEIDDATSDAELLTAWRKIETLGYRLHELLPPVEVDF